MMKRSRTIWATGTVLVLLAAALLHSGMRREAVVKCVVHAVETTGFAASCLAPFLCEVEIRDRGLFPRWDYAEELERIHGER